MNAAIAAVLKTAPSAHWVAALNEAGVACGPIYAIDQLFADPQVQQLGIARTVEHPRLGTLRLVGQPVQLSRTDPALRSAAPDAGQHSAEILAELGYDAAAIEELRRTRVI